MVSFVIIARNAENTLGELLEDVSKQTYDHNDIELILIDGQSQDGTLLCMTKYAEQHQDFRRVMVLDNPGKTLPCGWNVALEHALGDVILRVDAHCRIPQDFIAQNMKTLRETGEAICGGQIQSIMAQKDGWHQTLLIAENSAFGGGAAEFRRVSERKYVSTLAFAAYRREVFAQVGGYDERLARTEDNEIHKRMKDAGYRFLLDSDIHSSREARLTLSAMLRQKYLNGYWIGLTLSIRPSAFSLYHFVPLAFVLALLLSGAACLFSFPWLLFGLAVAYGLADLAMTCKGIVGQPLHWQYFVLPIIFLLMHLYYGIGTLVGIVYLPFWRSKHPNCPRIREVKDKLNERQSKQEKKQSEAM